MTGISKKIARVGVTLSGLYWAAAPVFAGPVNLCDSAQGQGANITALCNSTVENLVPKIISTVLFIAFLAALLFLIWGGIKWIMSGGDKEGAGKAKETVTSALIGLAIVLGSWILVNVVLTLFGSSGGLTKLNMPQLVP
jgi:hypothetical protein